MASVPEVFAPLTGGVLTPGGRLWFLGAPESQLSGGGGFYSADKSALA